MTLASVQELLIQQQQKVQELAHELATAKVLVPDPPAPPGSSCSSLCQFIACLMLFSDSGYTALVEKGGGHQAGDAAFSDEGCPFCL